MNTYAIIEDGAVANVAIADGEWPFPEQTAILVPEGSRPVIGGSPNPEDWVVAEVPVVVSLVPPVVTRFQYRAALYEAGHFPAIEVMMAAKDTPMLTRLAWADSQEFRRDSATVAAMAAGLGLSDHQVDELFISAAAIVA